MPANDKKTVGAELAREEALESANALNKSATFFAVFNNDLSGSRSEFGAGVAVKLSKDLQMHADFDYANGKSIEQPFGANVGLRYSW